MEATRAGSCKATKPGMRFRSMYNTLNLKRFFHSNISDKFYHIKILLGNCTRPVDKPVQFYLVHVFFKQLHNNTTKNLQGNRKLTCQVKGKHL